MNDHHRRMIHYHLDHMKVLEEQIAKLDRDIEEHIHKAGLEKQWQLLQSLPAVQQTSAASILAEVGPSTQPFPTQRNLSSWAGVCPGNNRSAGRNKGSRTTKGNKWLKSALTEISWGAANKKGCFLKDKFWRVKTKSKGKDGPAIVAVAHTLLMLIYNVLSTGEPYRERGVPELDEKQKDRAIRHHIRRLGKLGIEACSPRLATGVSGSTRPCRVALSEKKPKAARKQATTSSNGEKKPRRRSKSRSI